MIRSLALAFVVAISGGALSLPVLAQETACGKFAPACYAGAGISADQAQTIVRTARDYASSKSMAVAVAVVDQSGRLLAFGRSDGATHAATDGAIAKAVTAVTQAVDTEKLQAFMESGAKALPYTSSALQILPIEGGVLVLTGDKRIMGAIGIGGAAVFDGATDEEKKAPNAGIARRARASVIP